MVPNRLERDHRHLAGAAGGVPGQCHGEVHEQLPDARLLHEAAEHHEDDHERRRNGERLAENTLRRHVELVEDAHRLELGDEQPVQQEQDGGDGQRQVDATAGRLQHDHDQDRAENHVGPRQIVDVVDAGDDVFVIDEQVEQRSDAERQPDIVDDIRDRPLHPHLAAVDQEHQHEREQEVRAAEDDRFRRPAHDDPHVVEDHRDGHHRHGETRKAAVTEIDLDHDCVPLPLAGMRANTASSPTQRTTAPAPANSLNESSR